jgi:hypothetical protein
MNYLNKYLKFILVVVHFEMENVHKVSWKFIN